MSGGATESLQIALREFLDEIGPELSRRRRLAEELEGVITEAHTSVEECAECGEAREHHGPIPFVPKPPDDYSNPEEWEAKDE